MQEIGICGIIRGVTQRNAANLWRLSPPLSGHTYTRSLTLADLLVQLKRPNFIVERTCLARRQAIEAAIGKLERKLKKEKQINRQFEISGEIRKLKAEFNSIHS